MTARLFVHIGTHKTGTTSIQAILYRFSHQLKRAGTTVVKAGCPTPGLSGHHNIGWLMRGDPRAREKWGTLDDLVAELRRIRTPRAVISSEDLEYLVEYPDQLRVFEQKIRAAGWEPNYILFLREPAGYAISLFTELLKSGLTGSFEDFMTTVLRDGRFQMLGDWTFYLDYEAFLRKWREAATGVINIQSYDRANAGAGVIETFFDCIGVPPNLAGLRGGEVKLGLLEKLLQKHEFKASLAKLLRKLNCGRVYPEGANPAQLNIGSAKVDADMRARATAISAKYGPIFDRITALPTPGGATNLFGPSTSTIR